MGSYLEASSALAIDAITIPCLVVVAMSINTDNTNSRKVAASIFGFTTFLSAPATGLDTNQVKVAADEFAKRASHRMRRHLAIREVLVNAASPTPA